MRALFLGLGSVGRRHLRVLKGIADANVACVRSGRGSDISAFMAEHELKEFPGLGTALASRPDFAVVSNPTALHAETALQLAGAGVPSLVEKPLSDRLEGLVELKQAVAQRPLPVMVGFQMRHHPGFKRLREAVESGRIGRPLSLQGHVGQYLPDWRPGTDYRQSYSAKRDLGGGVILDLCHEIDIATAILGPARSASCVCGRLSELEIETEDTAEITLEHIGGGLSHLHLDYLERGYEWITRVVGTEGSAVWDCGRGFVRLLSPGGKEECRDDPQGFERDWLFRDQMKQWLAVLEGKERPAVDLDQGIHVTRVAVAAKESAERGQRVPIEEAGQ